MSTTNPRDSGTEWEDLQRKFGNLPAKPKEVTEEELTCQLVNRLEDGGPSASTSMNLLDKPGDEVDHEIIAAYRKKRLQEWKRRQTLARFGDLLHLGKDEFLKEVTEASAVDADALLETDGESRAGAADSDSQPRERGTWVFVQLYQDAVAACRVLNDILPAVARRHPSVKFIKAVSTDVIKDFPDSRLPTVLLYFGGTCRKQIVGAAEWGGDSINQRSVEKALRRFKVISVAEDDEESDRGLSGNSSQVLEGEECGSDEETRRVHSKGYASTKLDSLFSRRR